MVQTVVFANPVQEASACGGAETNDFFVESRKESALRIPFERNIIRTNVHDH
jgi:hypothetical protein